MFQNNILYAKKNIAFVICFIFFTGILFSQEVPRIVDNKIIFLDNVTQIQLNENDSYHVFPKQGRIVYIKQQIKSNYGEYILNFYDFKGKKIAQPDTVTGEMRFVFSEVNQRVLSGQIAVLTRQNKSYLYDFDGKLLNVLNHDYDTKQIGITDDEKYFWFSANKMRPLNPGEKPFIPNLSYTPYNHIMVFDVNTGNFLMDYSTLESNFSFCLNGKKYTISVMPPDLPG